MNACRDCKWCRPHHPILGRIFWGPTKVWEFAQCSNPNVEEINCATGEPERNYADRQRDSSYGKCGKQGKFFEPR